MNDMELRQIIQNAIGDATEAILMGIQEQHELDRTLMKVMRNQDKVLRGE